MAAADFAPNPRDSCVLRGDADATHAASVAANSHARTHPRRSVAFRRAEACISSRYGSVTSPSIGFRGSYRAPPWRVEAVARRCEARRSASPTLNARAGLPTVAVVARGKKKKKRDRRVQTKLRESWSVAPSNQVVDRVVSQKSFIATAHYSPLTLARLHLFMVAMSSRSIAPSSASCTTSFTSGT